MVTTNRASLHLDQSTLAVVRSVQRMRAALIQAELESVRPDWVFEDMLRRGVAAHVLAKCAGATEGGQAFSLGLTQDLGLIHLALKHPDKAPIVEVTAALPASRRLLEERAHLGADHAQAYREAAQRWELPLEFAELVEAHHDPSAHFDSRRMQRLLALSRAADALADVTQAEAASGTWETLTRALSALPARKELDLRAVFEELRVQMPVFAAELGWPIEEQPSWQDLRSHAGPSALHVSRGFAGLTRNLETLQLQLREVQRGIQDQARRQQPERDPHTGALSYPALCVRLRETLDAVVGAGQDFALLWVRGPDLQAWQGLPALLRASDEFCSFDGAWQVLLPDTGEQGAAIVSERLIERLPGVLSVGMHVQSGTGLLPGARTVMERAREAARLPAGGEH